MRYKNDKLLCGMNSLAQKLERSVV